MKLLKKLIIWMLLSVILQCGMLYGLEQTIFKNTSEFETSNLELNKDKKMEIDASVPADAENTSISYNGKYLTYQKDGKLYVEDTQTGENNEVITKDNGEILYHKWLSDRDRIIIAEKAEIQGVNKVQLLTYNPKDNSQIVVKTICDYTDNMEIRKISASVLTGVYYIDVYKGGMKSTLYRVDRNEDLTQVFLNANILGNLEVIPREDRLIYEDKTNNSFYITNPNNRLIFDSNINLALLGISKDGIVFVGELDEEKISKIIYGSVDEDTSTWQTKELEDVINRDDVYFNENNEIIVNHNLEGKIKNLMTNEEIEYEGKMIEIKENFVATVDGDGKLQYTYFNTDDEK